MSKFELIFWIMYGIVFITGNIQNIIRPAPTYNGLYDLFTSLLAKLLVTYIAIPLTIYWALQFIFWLLRIKGY